MHIYHSFSPVCVFKCLLKLSLVIKLCHNDCIYILWFLSSLCLQMDHKLTILWERLLILATLIWLFPSMCPHIYIKIIKTRKSLPQWQHLWLHMVLTNGISSDRHYDYNFQVIMIYIMFIISINLYREF